jgi:RNA 3'-terminal phosphate cyclase (ATP)
MLFHQALLYVFTNKLVGLKAQHAASINYLAEATAAETLGCSVGSKSFNFRATTSPAALVNRSIKIKTESVASILLIFQSILPFLIFAGDAKHTPIMITIQGGTNVSFSLSYEYLDQVLLPTLERFGINVERKLESRGWSHGAPQLGSIIFEITPLAPGMTLRSPSWPTECGTISNIDISIIVPRELQRPLTEALLFNLNLVFPGVEARFVVVEDSGHKARIYTLLVAHTSTGLRFGRDWLYDRKTNNKSTDDLSSEISQKVIESVIFLP